MSLRGRAAGAAVDVPPPPGLLQVSPALRRSSAPASHSSSGELFVPPGVLGYNAAAAAAAAAAATSPRSTAGTATGRPAAGAGAALGAGAAFGGDLHATGDSQQRPALKLQLHLKRPFHLGLKSLADPERDSMEHDLVSELCAALNLDVGSVELLNVSHPASSGPIQPGASVSDVDGSGTPAAGASSSLLSLRNGKIDGSSSGGGTSSSTGPLSDFDLSTLKSFACMFHCDDYGHLRVREIVARLRSNISLAPLLQRPLQLHGSRVPTAQSLNSRFSSMYIAPGTTSTFEELIEFFGADSERLARYTAAHPVAINALFLKDFEVSYAQRAFRGMDVTRSTFLKRSVLVPATAQLPPNAGGGDLRDRFDAFGDEYMNEVEFVHVLDSVHGEFMSAWSFKQLLEQVEKSYLRLLLAE
jgi:hypothetical protein